MIKADIYFKQNIEKILNFGYYDENPRPKYKDGTPAYTKYITQVFEEYDISQGDFPITTLRNTAVKTGINEILWIYQDQTNSLTAARKRGINWWDEWNIGDDTIGIRYGETVKRYDLINKLLTNLVKDPFSRRHIINLFQEIDLSMSSGLYPCAYETIWAVRKTNSKTYLDMTLVQRSSDFLTANFINKSQYVALLMMVASHCGYEVGKFCHYVHNLHIYDRHVDAAKEILEKEPLDVQPKIVLESGRKFYEIGIDDFKFVNMEKITKIKNKLELGI